MTSDLFSEAARSHLPATEAPTDDPFDSIPGVTPRTEEERAEAAANASKDPRSKIPLEGASSKPKAVSHNERTIKYWQDRGCSIAPVELKLTNSMGFAYKRDLFGMADWIVVEPSGRVLFVQTTNREKVNEHIKKVANGKYKLGSSAEYPILPVLRLIWKNPNAALVMQGWYKDGRFWKETTVEVTPSVVDAVLGRMRRAG